MRAVGVAACGGSRLALAAICGLLASCASDGVVGPATAEYRPAQRSALVSGRSVEFLVASRQETAGSTTVLARQQGGSTPRPVARLVEVRQGRAAFVSVQKFPEQWAATGRAERELGTLEQLYSMVLRLDPQARYCLSDDRSSCDPTGAGVSHADVLLAIAERRARAAAEAPAAVPWQVIELQPSGTQAFDADVVGVRAKGPTGWLANVSIHFDRAPHSICHARTGSDGLANCRLEDQHGDGHQHDHATMVVATFPGDVRADRVLLPTTQVLPSAAAGTSRPSFGSPIPFPVPRP